MSLVFLSGILISYSKNSCEKIVYFLRERLHSSIENSSLNKNFLQEIANFFLQENYFLPSEVAYFYGSVIRSGM